MVSEGLCVLSVQSPRSGKHDGGVQVCDDSRHGAGCCDAGLGAAVTCLQGCQHMGDLQEEDGSVRRGGSDQVKVKVPKAFNVKP